MKSEYLLKKELAHVYAALMPENRLVCQVCAATGLRVGDVLSLKTVDIKPQFWIKEAKTGKRRRVNLSRDLLSALLAQAGKVFVFESRCDPQRHRTRQAVWKDIKRASKAFRLPQNVSVHSLRKIFAVNLLEKSHGDLEKVRKALNHTDAATTMIYCMALQLYTSKYGSRNG